MSTLDSEVRSVVDSFMQSGELFTALDVSNKVKMAQPLAKHREVRELVRSMFTTDIQPAGWARTPITVTLTDGNTAEALLYHPLSDSWDLDNKYDAQKRQQAAIHAAPKASAVVFPAPSAFVQVPAVVTAAPVAPLPAKDMWNALFSTQPSLFPRK
jgi:hypothetical protein